MADECDACVIERIGCPCDGALDAGCFHCTPEKHARPECPPTCPNYAKALPGKIRKAVESGNVSMGGNVMASVAAMLADPHPREKTEQEKAYHEMGARGRYQGRPPADAADRERRQTQRPAALHGDDPCFAPSFWGHEDGRHVLFFRAGKGDRRAQRGGHLRVQLPARGHRSDRGRLALWRLSQRAILVRLEGGFEGRGLRSHRTQPEAYANVFNIGGVG